MSTTSMLSSNALAVKLWAKEDYLDMYKSTVFGRMLSSGTLHYATELNNASKGDQITFAFNGILTGLGVGEGGTLVGNEEGLALSSDSMAINVVRWAVNNPNDDTIEQQRTHVPFYKNARELLKGWHKSRVEWSIFNQLAGANSTTYQVDGTTYSTAATLPFVRGNNPIAAPTTNRILRPGGATTDQGLTSSDTLTLDMIDAAIELTKRTYPTVEPLNRDGDESFDLYISWEQLTDLKRDTTGKIQWSQNYLSAMAGGMIKDNPIFTNTIGAKAVARYANVFIIPSTRIAYGVSSADSTIVTNVRRAVMVGKNAGAVGTVQGGRLTDNTVPLIYKTQFQDYEYYKGIEARLIWGVTKLQGTSAGNTEDWGSIVLSTWAAPHSA